MIDIGSEYGFWSKSGVLLTVPWVESVACPLCWIHFSCHYRSLSDRRAATLASWDDVVFFSLLGRTADIPKWEIWKPGSSNAKYIANDNTVA